MLIVKDKMHLCESEMKGIIATYHCSTDKEQLHTTDTLHHLVHNFYGNYDVPSFAFSVLFINIMF